MYTVMPTNTITNSTQPTIHPMIKNIKPTSIPFESSY